MKVSRTAETLAVRQIQLERLREGALQDPPGPGSRMGSDRVW